MNPFVQAAHEIHRCWQHGETLLALPSECRPETPEQGYAIQEALARLRNEPVAGWKIAATAEAGRRHIRVDRPLAGRLYASIVHSDQAQLSLTGNRMRVAEAEVVLSLIRDLAPRSEPYTDTEVAAAVGHVHAGLELPDSRFVDFTAQGTACLIADNACARHFVLGRPATLPADLSTLAALPTALRINGKIATTGHGFDALGGPLPALTWLVNTLSSLGLTLNAGQFVTTGVTGAPTPIKPGDRLSVEIGSKITVGASVTDSESL